MKRTAISAVLAQPWAITAEALEQIRAIAEREHEFAGKLDALEAKLGRPLDNTRTVTVRDGVALIPVEGPLMAKANIFAQISGATSYQMIALDFTEALESAEVHSIVMLYDTPGGAVNGVSETSSLILKARGVKPIYAFVTGTVASAGYWMASAADKIYAADTAMIGSIGTVISVRETKEREGEKTYEFVSAQSPLKRVGPGTDEGASQYQRLADDAAQVFIDAVASNRGTNAENVLNSYGKGAVFLAADALERGMIDGITTLEDLITELSTEAKSMDYKELNIAALTENRPDLVKAIGEQAVAAAAIPAPDALRAEGAKAERDRIAAIEATAVPGAEEIITAAKADPNATAADTAMKIIAGIRDGSIKAATAPETATEAAALAALKSTEAGITPPKSMENKGDETTNPVDEALAAAKAAGVNV